MMNKNLALLGGIPVHTGKWPFFHTIGDEEKEAVAKVLDSGELSAFIAAPGPRFEGGAAVQKLEQAWGDYFRVPYSISMNSATTAIWAALKACEINLEDEVIMPQLGMSAIAASTVLCGAIPIFADCHPETMLIDPGSIQELITSQTKAIIVVHLAGQIAPMEEILNLAKRHNLRVIEDNAQAIDARYQENFGGTIGDIGVFSLNCHKIIQSGEGGVACTHDKTLAEKLKLIRNHAEKCVHAWPEKFHHLFGLNLRMTELEAAVAYEQLKKLPRLSSETVKRVRFIESFSYPEYIRLAKKSPHSTHVYYIYHWSYKSDDAPIPAGMFAQALQAEGFPIYANYGYLISELAPFQKYHDEQSKKTKNWPGSREAIKNSLWTMGLRPNIGFDLLEKMQQAFIKVDKQSKLL